MKKIRLLPLVAIIGSFSSASIASPVSDPPGGACPAATCCETKCTEVESVAAAQKRVMAAELAGLVERYVSDVSLRSYLLRTLQRDPERALDFVALAKATFSEADHACFKRVANHFKC